MAQIQEIDREMVRVQTKFGVPTRNPALAQVAVSSIPSRTKGRRAKRGALKEKMLQALRVAGRKGATIGELSSKLGVRSANLYVWFNSTGRNVRGLRKIGTAKYRLG